MLVTVKHVSHIYIPIITQPTTFDWLMVKSITYSKVHGANMGPPGSCRPRLAPCWPYEPCSQGWPTVRIRFRIRMMILILTVGHPMAYGGLSLLDMDYIEPDGSRNWCVWNYQHSVKISYQCVSKYTTPKDISALGISLRIPCWIGCYGSPLNDLKGCFRFSDWLCYFWPWINHLPSVYRSTFGKSQISVISIQLRIFFSLLCKYTLRVIDDI